MNVEQYRESASLKSVGGIVVQGFVWLNGLTLFSTVLSFIIMIIIARVLEPHLVGLVAVFYIISGALDSFTATGFRKAIIQRKEIGQEYIDTTFVIHLLRGISLASGIFLSAPLLVEMLGAPEAQYLVQVMAISILFQGARNPGALFFMRRLTFYKQFIWHISSALVRFVTTIALLYILKNEWAIVYGVLAYEFAMLLLSFVLIDIRPSLKWDRKAFQELFNYGKWVLLASIVAFIERQGNQIGTVKLLGEASLGVLFLGLRIANMPTLISQQLKNTLFPVFSRLQDSSEKTKRLYQRSIGIVALFIFPVAGCAVVFAGPFTRLFLGTTWTQVAGILGLLVCARAIQAVTMGISLLNARGMPQFAFFNHLLRGIIIVIGIYPLIKVFGLKGVAILYGIVGIGSFAFCLTVLVRYLHFEIALFGVLLTPTLASTITSASFYLGHHVLPINSIPIFCGVVAAFFILYFALIFVWDIVDSKSDRSVNILLSMRLIKKVFWSMKERSPVL